MKHLNVLAAATDKVIPAGWKRPLGMAAVLAAVILERFRVITENEEDSIILLGISLIGVGIAAARHRVMMKANKP